MYIFPNLYYNRQEGGAIVDDYNNRGEDRTIMGEKIIARLLGVFCLFMLAGSVSHAEIQGDGAFDDLNWELQYEDQAAGDVQSICATEDYIITIDNVSDSPADSDIVSAYYKNDMDEHGNPVERYSLAKRVADTCWEHGNGMTYNPNTHEIYVALYTNTIPENRGCVYVMDPDTLAYKRTIKVSDEYNLLGIGYMEDTNQYMIQTNAEDGYSFKILDENFRLVEDLGEYGESGKGYNFQDLEVSGDYILNFPLTLNIGIGDYLQVYSISRRALVAAPKIDFRLENVVMDEPESICETEPGVFLAAVNVEGADGVKRIRFYQIEVPYNLYVNVTYNDKKMTRQRVSRGEDVQIDCTPWEGYELTHLTVNGKDLMESGGGQDFEGGYLLQNIREDQNIEVIFEEPEKAVSMPQEGEEIPIEKNSVLSIEWTAGLVCSVCAAGILVVMYLYYMHVRAERRRKALRAKKRRNISI